MAFVKKTTGLTQKFPKPTSQVVGNMFKLILLTTISLVIPPSSSRPLPISTCPTTTTLDIEFMQDFVDAAELDLSYCKLRVVTPPAFGEMVRLEKLSMAGNKLDQLWEGEFEECTVLKTVDLSNNRFTVLPFLNSNSIKHLIIRDNGIECISATTLDGLPNLESLDLRGNPVCQVKECDMKSPDVISKWLQSQNTTTSPNTTKVVSKDKVDRKSKKNNNNGTLPGKTDFAMNEDVYPILSAAVIIIGLCMAVCALIVICSPHEEYVRGTEGFRKLTPRVQVPASPPPPPPPAPKVELEEVVSSDADTDQDQDEKPSWKKQLHLLYLIMKHSAECGARPIKL